ncbi:hypothetical protein Mterra_01781 [Calidithermus terrae]|uniref:Uncharacterized protein n=1 Tax=Calidithermus terrae TaxID=1408545 RepID=A0A399ENE8_9DEIN|nr:hypothetical protein Mterra_01781 [Calidithermus terrae]
MSTLSQNCIAPEKPTMSLKKMVGDIMGTVMARNWRKGLAPSMAAAS